MKKIRISIITTIVIICVMCVCVWQLVAFATEGSTARSEQNTETVDKVIEQTKKYILTLDKNPGYGSEWFVLGLARFGLNPNTDYFKTYYKNITEYIRQKEGKIHQIKCTEYSKTILALTSIGIDAEDVADYNLFMDLADFNMVMRQGINGPIWTLIALKSNPKYSIPVVSNVKVQTTEQLLVNTVLEKEISGGGWSLDGKMPDIDITAMALQALAPYYKSEGYEKVTAAVDRGLKILSSMQNADTGGVQKAGVENCESCAQVITSLAALGIDPRADHRFVKNGHQLIDSLISYHITGSGFMHVKNQSASETVNGMATEQAFYALVSYKRFLCGQKSLYDMSDVKLKKGEQVDTAKRENTRTTKKNKQTTDNGKTVETVTVSKEEITKRGQALRQNNNTVLNDKAIETEADKERNTTEKENGWSFVGEDYSIENLAALEQESVTKANTPDDKRNRMNILLCFIGASMVTAGAGYVYLRKKRGQSGESQ